MKFWRGSITALGATLGWWFIAAFGVFATATVWISYLYWFRPGDRAFAKIRPPVCTELLGRKGKPLDYICPFDGVRLWVKLNEIDPKLRDLVIMLEDDKFYDHGGLDLDQIWNSVESNLEKGKFARGGSTITQQLAKNLFLTKEKSLFRKASEVPLAIRLEKEFSKDQLLELYFNTIEWGPGVFGVEAAARLYFDHSANELNDAEAWLLALMIPNPRELNLWVTPTGRKSLEKRALHLSERLHSERKQPKDESQAKLKVFLEFLEQWQAKRPFGTWGETLDRHYPALWAFNTRFRLGDLKGLAHRSTGIINRMTQSPLRCELDRDIQASLEQTAVNPPRLHPEKNGKSARVYMLTDGNKIRALVPLPADIESDFGRWPKLQVLLESSQLKPRVDDLYKIPAEAFWP